MYSVMIVDDEKAIRDNLASIVPFESEGFYLVTTAMNGEDALQKMEDNKIDVILLDISMPVLDGIGFLEKLGQRKCNDIKIIVLSGYSEFEYAKAAMRYGVKAYLTKPVDEDELILLLREIRQELETRKTLKITENLMRKVEGFQSLLRGKEIDKSFLEDTFLLHCVVMGDKKDHSYNVLKEYMEEVMNITDVALIRCRGGVYSYLMPAFLLDGYHKEGVAYAKHIQHVLKEQGLICTILIDQKYLEEQGVFKKIYDTHLFQMLTQVFYGMTGVCIYERKMKEDDISGIESSLKKFTEFIYEQNHEKAEEQLDSLFNEMKEKKISIEYVQGINYRIYYLFLAQLGKSSGKDVFENIVPKIDLWEYRFFLTYELWIDVQKERLHKVISLMEEQCRDNKLGVWNDILSYVQQHYREGISVKQVAEIFYMNAAYMGRTFQKVTGIGFKQYVNQLRIKEAKYLLKNTDMMVYEIAEKVGFAESKYFIAKFTEEIGESPSEYRRIKGEKK